MSNPADLSLDQWSDWLLLVVGLAILLLPGLAVADRLTRSPRGLLLAPVLSFTVLPLAAIGLDFLFNVTINATTTTLLALGLAALAGRHRLEAWFASPGALQLPQPRPPRRATRRPLSVRILGAVPATFGMLAILAMVAFMHSLPHVPGAAGDDPDAAPRGASAIDGLIGRAQLALAGDDYPYPIHVDEHAHLARAAEVVRSGQSEIVDPYTGEPLAGSLLSLEGNVHERGFEVALAQIHLLTSVAWGVLFRFGPAIWAAYIAALAWGVARPHAGAAAGALALISLPTSVMFLGVGFLVPISAGLAWIVASLWISTRCSGLARLAGTLLVISGGFFIHLIAGALCIVVALSAAAVRAGSWRDRLAAGASTLIPLVWIGPAVQNEVAERVATNIARPSGREIFAFAGPIAPLFAVAGAILVYWRPTPTNQAHRAAALSMVVLLASINLSLWTGVRSLALYYRPVHALFLLGALVAGYGAGELGHAIARWMGGRNSDPWLRGRVAVVAAVVLVGLGLPAVAHEQMAMPYYRAFDEESWDAAATFADSGAGPDDLFLSHPWRAPVYNAFTGARPLAVLYPGSPPAGGSLFTFYERTNGANEVWLQENDLDWIVSSTPPNAPARSLGPSVHQLGAP